MCLLYIFIYYKYIFYIIFSSLIYYIPTTVFPLPSTPTSSPQPHLSPPDIFDTGKDNTLLKGYLCR